MFPLAFVPRERFDQGMRRFGANRDGGKRIHAGCDLYAKHFTPVYAVQDGIVTAFGPFYYEVFALVVDHGDFIVRYGEVEGKGVPGIKVGTSVTGGQLIAHVGYMKKIKMSMVHFEMFSGAASGPLTVSGNKYKRRSDLMDPTPYLKKWEAELITAQEISKIDKRLRIA